LNVFIKYSDKVVTIRTSVFMVPSQSMHYLMDSTISGAAGGKPNPLWLVAQTHLANIWCTPV